MQTDSHPQDSIAVLKRQWRHHLKNIREDLSFKRRQDASQYAFEELRVMCQKARFVLSFASFASEINLWTLNEELCIEGRLVLPFLTEKEGLYLFQVSHFSQLKLHRLGMVEPNPLICQQIDLSMIEIALIPGLGFDQEQKQRLGYGKGAYDKFLRFSSKIKKWGIGFLEQKVVNLPFTDNDTSLDDIYLF
ncbi:MAG: 5-formyltetrahydrofolate cyclo-ligase [Parachlamydiaceae bacterium]